MVLPGLAVYDVLGGRLGFEECVALCPWLEPVVCIGYGWIVVCFEFSPAPCSCEVFVESLRCRLLAFSLVMAEQHLLWALCSRPYSALLRVFVLTTFARGLDSRGVSSLGFLAVGGLVLFPPGALLQPRR